MFGRDERRHRHYNGVPPLGPTRSIDLYFWLPWGPAFMQVLPSSTLASEPCLSEHHFLFFTYNWETISILDGTSDPRNKSDIYWKPRHTQRIPMTSCRNTLGDHTRPFAPPPPRSDNLPSKGLGRIQAGKFLFY